MAICGVFATITSVSHLHASTVVFQDDFSSSNYTTNGNSYIGGSGTQLVFNQWTGSNSGNILGEQLNVTSTSGSRVAALALGPEAFGVEGAGAGTYTITFDLTSFLNLANGTALVSVTSVSGFSAPGTRGQAGNNRARVNTINASVLPQSAEVSVSTLASTQLNAASTGNTISFEYDGSSAIVLFFGASADGSPFPTTSFDNISVSKIDIQAVPEPAAPALLGLAGAMLLLVRRK